MKHSAWKIELLSVILVLSLAEAGYVSLLSLTFTRVFVLLVLVALAFGINLLSPALERLGNAPFWTGALGVFAFSRLAWLAAVPTVQVSDFHYYYQAACSIANGHGINDPSLALYPNWWGYPLVLSLFLRIFGCSEAVGKILNLFLGAATIPALYLLATRFGGKRVGRCAVLLFLIWPVQLMFTSVTATEHLALLLAVIGFMFGARLLDRDGNPLRNAALCGVFLTLGSIVRPAIMTITAAVVLILLFRIRPWKAVLAALAVFAVSTLVLTIAYGWIFTALSHGIKPAPGFSTAANLLYGSNYQEHGMWNAGDFATINGWPKEQALHNALEISRRRFQSYSSGQILSLLWTKNREFWALPYYGFLFSTRELAGPPKLSWLTDPRVGDLQYYFQLFLVAACTLGIVRFLRGRPLPVVETAAGATLLGTALHLVFVVSSRYAYPFTALLLVFAAAGLAKASPTHADPPRSEAEPEIASLQAATGRGFRLSVLTWLIVLTSACCSASFIGRNGLAIFHWDDSEYLIGALDTLHDIQAHGYWTWPGYIFAHQHYGRPPLYVNTLTAALAFTGKRPVAAAALIVALTTLLLGFLVYGFVNRVAGSRYALLAVIAILGMPAVGVWDTQAYPDVQLACLVVSVYWLIATDIKTLRWALLLGLLLGLGMLAKSTFPLFVGLPLLYWAWQGGEAGNQRRRRFGFLVLAAAVGCLIASIWYIRNLEEVIAYVRRSTAVNEQPVATHLHDWLAVLTGQGIGYCLLLLSAVVVWVTRRSGRSAAAISPVNLPLLAFLGGFPMVLLAMRSSVLANSRHTLPSLVLFALSLLLLIFKGLESRRSQALGLIVWLSLGIQWLVTCAVQTSVISDRSPLASWLLPIAPGLRTMRATSFEAVDDVRLYAESAGQSTPVWYCSGNDEFLNATRLQLASTVFNLPMRFEYTCTGTAEECRSQLSRLGSTSSRVVLYMRPWEQIGGLYASWNRNSKLVQAILDDPQNKFHKTAELLRSGYTLAFYSTGDPTLQFAGLPPIFADFGRRLLLLGAKLEGRELILKLKVNSPNTFNNYKLLLHAHELGTPADKLLLWDRYFEPPLTSLRVGEIHIFSFVLPEESAKGDYDFDIGVFDESDTAHHWPPLRVTTGEPFFTVSTTELRVSKNPGVQ